MPKYARSPNVQPLKDYRIVVTKNALERLVKGFIVMYGGSYRDKVDKNTTHIISSQPSSSEKNEIRKAQDNGPQIVDPDFLLKIISDNRANLYKKARHCSPVAMAHGTVEGLDNRSDDIMEGKHVRFKVESPPPNNRDGGKAPKSNIKAEPNTEDDGKKEFENTPEKYSLYIPQDSKRAYEAKLKKSSYFYDIKVVKNSGATKFLTLTSFGRNGKIWVERSLGDGSVDDAVNKFRDMFKDKTGLDWEHRNDEAQDGKYAFGNGREPVQKLMQLIFNEEGFNMAKNALGYKYSLESLKDYDIELQFKTLAKEAAMARRSHKDRTKAKTDKDHEIHPSADGIHIQDLSTWKRSAKQLQGLWQLKNAYEIMKAASNSGKEVQLFNRQFQDMTALSQESVEFQTVNQYLNNHRAFDKYEVKDIFRINLGEEPSPYHPDKDSKRYLLWHGSRAVNYCSILSHGLQIPPPRGPLTGSLFAKGIDLTDISSVAAQDCNTRSDALLLLCEAAIAKENYTRGRVGPSKWIDAEKVHKTLKGVNMVSFTHYRQIGLNFFFFSSNAQLRQPNPTIKPKTNFLEADSQYNKYTCYDPAQVRLRYLLRFDAPLSGKEGNHEPKPETGTT
ncbi:Poly polymerase 1 [Fusarium oxysporum f. sp. conglutinans]|nr:Poly polymerase 1 [Fusarium oxysporum f. sp. conglutinans]